MKNDINKFIQDRQNLLHFHLLRKYFRPIIKKNNREFLLKSENVDDYHLPNLHYVIFWNWTDNPWFSWVPWKVRDFSCMTTMNKLNKRKYTIVLLKFVMPFLLIIQVDHLLHHRLFALHQFYYINEQFYLTTERKNSCDWILP